MKVERIDYKWPDGSLLKSIRNEWEDDDGSTWVELGIKSLLRHGAIVPAPKPFKLVFEGTVAEDCVVRFMDDGACSHDIVCGPDLTPGTPVTITVEGE